MDNFPNLFFSLFEEKYYVYNVFKTLSQQIICGRLLQVINDGKKVISIIDLNFVWVNGNIY